MKKIIGNKIKSVRNVATQCLQRNTQQKVSVISKLQI